MANIPLQSITFPGLSDKYTTPTVDATLTQTGAAADAKKTGDEIGALKNDLSEKADKTDVLSAYVIETETGSIASFTDGADDVPVKDLIVSIEPVQSGSGDPSPDNVRPISGWTGANVTRTGKNLVEDALVGYNIISDGTFEASLSFKMNIAPVKAGVQYAISSSDKYFIGGFFTEKPTSASTSYNNSRTVELTSTFVAPIDGYVVFRSSASFSTPQLELGSTATAYEPYQGETYEVDWTTEAGTVYGGTLDVTTGVLTVDTARIALSSLYFEVVNDNYFYSEVTGIAYNSARIWSDTYKTTGPYNGYNEINFENCSIAISQSNARIAIRDDSYSDVASFVASLTDKYIVYGLAEPQTYQLTPQEVSTILGQNNIFADTGNVTVQYRADTKLYIDKVLNT